LQPLLDHLNAFNATLEHMKSTEPHVIIVLQGLLQEQDRQVLTLVINAQRDILQALLAHLNAVSARQELMKSIDYLVLIVLQDLLQNILDLLNARSAMQDSMKSTEPLVIVVPLVHLLSLAHLALKAVIYAQQAL